jgi:hypothetical protein
MVNVNNEVWLHEKFKDYPWYHSVGKDQYGRLVVYVNYRCHETLYDIPDYVGAQQVLVHFASSKTATREQFVNDKSVRKLSSATLPPVLELVVDDEIEDLTNEAELDKEDLILELDRLEGICGSNILQDIFYEIHDGKNAVTKMSTRYPEVSASLHELYDFYGFDVIFNELDG